MIYMYINLFTKRKKEKVITAWKKFRNKEIRFSILIFRLFETVLGSKIKAFRLRSNQYSPNRVRIKPQTTFKSNRKIGPFCLRQPEQTSKHRLSAFNKGNTCTL